MCCIIFNVEDASVWNGYDAGLFFFPFEGAGAVVPGSLVQSFGFGLFAILVGPYLLFWLSAVHFSSSTVERLK